MLIIWWSSVPSSLKPFLNLELILQWPVAKCIQFDSYIMGLPQMQSQANTPKKMTAIPVYAEGPLSGVHWTGI